MHVVGACLSSDCSRNRRTALQIAEHMGDAAAMDSECAALAAAALHTDWHHDRLCTAGWQNNTSFRGVILGLTEERRTRFFQHLLRARELKRLCEKLPGVLHRPLVAALLTPEATGSAHAADTLLSPDRQQCSQTQEACAVAGVTGNAPGA